MFQKAKQNRTSENIASQIQEAILEGKFAVGDRLPSEQQLREIFQVSRGTLREALIALEQRGLISIKTGVKGGAIVRQVDTKGISESIDLLLRYQKIGMRELTEFREDVEGLIVEKAAKLATKEDVEELKVFLNAIKEQIQIGLAGWENILELDKSFHLALVRLTKNKIYESVLHSIYNNINSYLEKFLPRNTEVLKNNYKELHKILKAIENRNPEKASFYFRQHVKPYYKRIESDEKRREFRKEQGEAGPRF